MKTCRQIRYENARALMAEGDGPAAFAKKISGATDEPMTPQQVNSWGGPNPRRGIGDDIARRIEKAHKKEEGWLDHEHAADSSISGHKSPLSDEAKSLILCVERLDGIGDLARKTFVWHTGLLLLSSAAAELQTGLVQSQMLAELEQIGAAQSQSPGAPTNERKHRK
ncbi:MAG TPA: hypothetical protein VF534_27115 [Paraburkholderia sp.]